MWRVAPRWALPRVAWWILPVRPVRAAFGDLPGGAVTVARDVRERPGAARSEADGYDTWAGGTPLDGLARRAMRLPWCWPALLTLLFGCYQLDRPELWPDELWSWSFAADPVHELVASASRSNSAELGYDLVLHYWMAGLVFALLPSVSRFAQEVRFYAPVVLVVTVATLLLLCALDAPSVRRWAAYGACLAVVGYIDIVALLVIAGHAAGVALRWWQDRDVRLLGFAPAAAAGLAACLPLAAVSWGKAGTQVWWINRPGLDLYAFSSLVRNLFYSTSVAAAVIVLGVLAWASWRAAALATAMAVLPVGALWLLSQGPHSYFIGRYLLFTIGAWAILACIGLSRLDLRLSAAAVLVLAIFVAGDQQVIREPGAHSWSAYPAGYGGHYLDYAGAASTIAGEARAGDGIVYREGNLWWDMIGPGLQYYLHRDMPHGVQVPRELFVATTVPQSSQINPVACHHPAACLGDEPRIWIVGSGYQKDPYRAIAASRAAVLRPRYRLSLTRHFRGLTVFLLVRDVRPGPA